MPKPSPNDALRAIGEVVTDANTGGIAAIQENQRESQLSCISITETDAAVVAILPVQVDPAEQGPEPLAMQQQPSKSTILSSKEELIKGRFGRESRQALALPDAEAPHVNQQEHSPETREP